MKNSINLVEPMYVCYLYALLRLVVFDLCRRYTSWEWNVNAVIHDKYCISFIGAFVNRHPCDIAGFNVGYTFIFTSKNRWNILQQKWKTYIFAKIKIRFRNSFGTLRIFTPQFNLFLHNARFAFFFTRSFYLTQLYKYIVITRDGH